MVPKPQYYRERTVPRKCLDPAIFFSEPLVLPSWIDVLLKYPAAHTYCNITGIWERPAGIPSRSNMKIMRKEILGKGKGIQVKLELQVLMFINVFNAKI